MTTLTPGLLASLMECPQARAQECFQPLVDAMRAFHIDTNPRIVCFLTQAKWESTGLVNFAERADGSAYEGRADLGNTQPGDGPRFKGSGPIQVTGRSNFTNAQAALTAAGVKGPDGKPIDILANPDLARTVQYGPWISCWWWATNGGNTVAELVPLSYASLCCGRLVNLGNAYVPTPAMAETERIAAFDHITPFMPLELPPVAVPPVTPPPVKPPPVKLSACDVVFFPLAYSPTGVIYRANLLTGTYSWVPNSASLTEQKAVLTAAGVPWAVWPVPVVFLSAFGVLIGPAPA